MIAGIIASGGRARSAPSGIGGYGYILSVVAGVAAYPYSSERTDLSTWPNSFGGTINEGLFASALTSLGDTGVLAAKTVSGFSLLHRLQISAANADALSSIIQLDVEFLNSAGGVVAAVSIFRDGNQSVAMKYGASLTSLSYANAKGSNPRVSGIISFTAAGIGFAPNTADTRNFDPWNFSAAMSSVVSIRFSNARAYSAAAGSSGTVSATVWRLLS